MKMFLSSGGAPRIFVSSIVDGFEEYRNAARTGIEEAGAIPVLVNEDFPSLATSSRNACLDAIDSSDYVASIVGPRGGWTTPSGLLVVEEEFEHARRRGTPVLAFLQDTSRDDEAERFARRLSNYLDGAFRTTFRTPADLRQQVERAVRQKVDNVSPRRTGDRDLTSYFALDRRGATMMPMLRFVLVPEREEEVIDPVRIASKEFTRQLFEIGHSTHVELFSFDRQKSTDFQCADLVIQQTETSRRHGEGEHVRLQLAESGAVVIDGNVTGRVVRGTEGSLIDELVIALEDIEAVLGTFLKFSATLYQAIDPYSRHERFRYNVGLRGLGHRILERNPQPRHSYGMSMRGFDAVTAFELSRELSRAALVEPRAEIDRALVLFERKAGR